MEKTSLLCDGCGKKVKNSITWKVFQTILNQINSVKKNVLYAINSFPTNRQLNYHSFLIVKVLNKKQEKHGENFCRAILHFYAYNT